MKKIFTLIIAPFLLLVSCDTEKVVVPVSPIELIPNPSHIEQTSKRAFLFSSFTTFGLGENTPDEFKDELIKIGDMFNDKIEAPFGYRIEKAKNGAESSILFIIDKNFSKNGEDYSFESDSSRITIKAASPAGIFYGVQTLLQLLPSQVKSKTFVSDVRWSVPAVIINDSPRMAWRGVMLDVTRHFFTVEQVKNVIDQITEYKINHLHLHLADDQGWRLEIKALPELIEKTSMRPSRIGDWWKMDDTKADEPFDYGGYYTQDDIRTIINYAKSRYVEIIPEIDVPGHSLALMVTYPEFHCTKTSKFVNIGNEQGWEDFSLCIGNPNVMKKLEIIFKEVSELFPSEYIHIGGDECSKELWAKCPKCKKLMKEQNIKDVEGLQSYFIHGLDKYITSLGKKIIGWDEIMQGGLSPNAVVMSWRGVEGGKKAAQDGHKVIMSPNENCYLDLYKGDPAIEPRTYGKSRLKDSYNWNPVPEGVSEDLILGGQGNLWTETVTTIRHLEYCLYPNLWSLSEVFWSKQENREWNDFFSRVERHFERADFADINYAKSVYNAWVRPFTLNKDGNIYVDIVKELDDVDIYYTLDNTIPDMHAIKYDGTPFVMPGNSSKINIQTYRNGQPCGNLFRVTRDEINTRASRDKRE